MNEVVTFYLWTQQRAGCSTWCGRPAPVSSSPLGWWGNRDILPEIQDFFVGNAENHTNYRLEIA